MCERLITLFKRLYGPWKSPAAKAIAKDRKESANVYGVVEAVQHGVEMKLTAVDEELRTLRELRDAARH